MNENFDDLDRALFALPLATPPMDLRATILRGTIYAEASADALVPFALYEIVGVGLALAIGAWFVIAALADHRFAALVITTVSTIAHEVTEPQIVAWLTAGGAIAALMSLGSFTPLRRGDHKP